MALFFSPSFTGEAGLPGWVRALIVSAAALIGLGAVGYYVYRKCELSSFTLYCHWSLPVYINKSLNGEREGTWVT